MKNYFATFLKLDHILSSSPHIPSATATSNPPITDNINDSCIYQTFHRRSKMFQIRMKKISPIILPNVKLMLNPKRKLHQRRGKHLQENTRNQHLLKRSRNSGRNCRGPKGRVSI
ncbi:hypothetical protein Anas_08778 [Armadillidium nasatum]|uniref:Uncharacterized protein n=1 Tax=Armadillidium nasatum TaxID=96803 RepID=A0A5N5SM16_9CRUS|nr:hypothetical protein Anas_08778 [Armadillidium nasatum]